MVPFGDSSMNTRARGVESIDSVPVDAAAATVGVAAVAPPPNGLTTKTTTAAMAATAAIPPPMISNFFEPLLSEVDAYPCESSWPSSAWLMAAGFATFTSREMSLFFGVQACAGGSSGSDGAGASSCIGRSRSAGAASATAAGISAVAASTAGGT